MSISKYPVKYFCGSGLTRFHKRLIQNSFDTFIKSRPIKLPPFGETGIDGVLLDFNYGLRLQIPEGNWHVRITDAERDLTFLNDDISSVTLISMEKFYIEWEIALWLDGEPVFYHRFDPTEQKVHFHFAHAAIGDNIAMLPYIEAFRRTFGCEITISISPVFHGIVENYYPDFEVVKKIPDDSYACFYFSAFVNIPIAATSDARDVPLTRVGHTILDTQALILPPKIIYTPTESRSIKEPYVCIGVQASGTPKCWINPGGWDQVVDYLKGLGYRVLCIDRERTTSGYDLTIEMPRGAEDFSGDYTLLDRVNQLAYADFFIGVSSGLSWLAWAVDIPVVLISGITECWYEFSSAYRVYNPLVCHGCFNDLSIEPADMSRCVRRKEPALKYECSKKISARQVIAAVNRLIAAHKLLDGRFDR